MTPILDYGYYYWKGTVTHAMSYKKWKCSNPIVFIYNQDTHFCTLVLCSSFEVEYIMKETVNFI